MGNKTNSINLLKKPEKSFLEKFLAWTLTAGRVLVIITEAIALGAFLYRFGLDMKLVDLRDKIKPLRAYIELKKDDEQNYRDLQDRLKLAQKYNNSASQTNNLMQQIISLAKGNLVFDSISFETDTIRMSGVMHTTNNLSAFVSGLKALAPIKAISIDKIENKPSSAEIDVGLTLSLTNKTQP